MKTLLNFILISLFCLSTINSACTATVQATCEADTSCKWTVTPASCGGTGSTCAAQETQTACTEASCTWTAQSGACGDKTCPDYTTEATCNAVATCQWASSACSAKSSNNGNGNGDGDGDGEDDNAFGLKSSILILLISFLF